MHLLCIVSVLIINTAVPPEADKPAAEPREALAKWGSKINGAFLIYGKKYN